MINEPITLVAEGFQHVWRDVVRRMMDSHWELRNLLVQIRNPCLLDESIHNQIIDFTRCEGLLGPKHVAYTIFPHGLYRQTGNAGRLFDAYNRHNGLYERLKKRKRSWGTYFQRMTNYRKDDNIINQLGNIIDAIQTRQNISRAAYTIIIQKPGGETTRPLGGPCLNYIAVQIEPGNPITLGLLAVYRNHDFLERAYGNYWGLCNLIVFLCNEVGAELGPLSCLSSHAYVSGKKVALRELTEAL